MTSILAVVCLNLIPLAWAGAARAQNTSAAERDVPEKTGKNLNAFQLNGAAPRIDGRLDDDAWRAADRIDDFVQMAPANMEPATERTTVQVAYDARYIYVAVRCFVKDPIDISAGLGRRDNFPRSDRILCHFDPRHDHQTAYLYMVNPSGVQGDQTAYDDTSLSSDYDGVWDVETQIDAAGPLSFVERSATTANHIGVNGGLDIRLGLGSSTLSATINPDFGQVEADPAVLNLSVFETFFPEKRPFFLEDSRIFVLPYGQIPDFYSRRIGQTPGRLELKSGETLVSKPDQTTILGAAKFTGKASGWTWGGLGAVTSREYAAVDLTTEADGVTTTIGRANRLIEPATLYSVGRLQRDIRSSNIGFIGTAVVREEDLDAFTGGPDYNFRWGGNAYNVNGHWLATRAPISSVMRTGFGGVTNFSYNTKHVNSFVHVDHFGRNFRNTDLGFLGGRTNRNEFTASIGTAQPDPWKMFRSMNGNVGFGRSWTDERLVFGNFVYINMNAQFRNYWSTFGGLTRNFRRLDDLDTRGGPPIERAAGRFYNFGFNSDSRKRWGVNVFVNGGRDTTGARNFSWGPTLRMQPSDRLQASVSTNYTSGHDVAQWIKNEDLDGDGTEEHIYGRLRRNVVNITGRATYAFGPDMTLEAYLQPFVAVGDYTDIRKLARPSSFEFDPVTIDADPDFNRKSLRGTIVMRWEYLPGSTLFLV